MLDWNDLRYVLAISRGRSLSAAARALRVHQTTVGRRLDALEHALGAPLFLRSPTGLVPAPEGARLLGSIEQLADALATWEATLGRDQRGRSGIVRLALTENSVRIFVKHAFAKLRAAHPDVVIDLLPANAVADLTSGEADLAIRVVRPEAPDLVARRLGAVRYGLYATEGYLAARGRSTARGCRGHDILVPVRELAAGPEARWLAAHAAHARPALYASSHVAIASAAEEGIGLAVLPTNLAALHERLELLRPLPEIPERPVWLVMHKDARRHARVRTAASLVASAFTEVLAAG